MLAVPAGLGDFLASWVHEHEAASICSILLGKQPPGDLTATQTINPFPFFSPPQMHYFWWSF